MSLFNEEKILVKLPAKGKDAIQVVIAFPNAYNIGMASLGYQTAWKLLSLNKEIKVARWFTDIEENTTSKPGYIGFSFSWELDYKNIFSMLEKNKISIHSKEREEDDPLIFCGGQVPNANPAPFIENFDFFIIGDLEVLSKPLTERMCQIKNLSRIKKLEKLSELNGVYVPSLTSKAFAREFSKNTLTSSSILTKNCVWPDVFLLEVVRSCPELCRFCLASYGSLPFRTPSLNESLIPLVDFGLKYTNKIGLLGASVSQHPEFEKLLEYLISKSSLASPIQAQIGSIRADTVSESLAPNLHKLGAKSLTMAVETGSEKLRTIINKKVTNENIFNSVKAIFNAGFDLIKLYGMVGLPFETIDDLSETVKLLESLKKIKKGGKITWGCSVFVPKAQTPFQWFGVDKSAESKLDFLKKELHKIGVDFRAESYKWSIIQALISRGDKSINKSLEKAYRYGNTLGSFNKAIKEEGINLDEIVFNVWNENKLLPWENIQGYLNKKTVLEHSKKVLSMV
jgi:radical SAM superfamily enzyme YgiQ (UPF0313 family)